MRLLNFIIIKLTICLAIGIVLAHHYVLKFSTGIYTSIGLLSILGIFWLCIRQKINRSPSFAILSYCCMISLGINAYNIQNERLQPLHYTNLNLAPSFKSITFKIKERLKQDSFNDKYIASLISVDDKYASGNLLLIINKDSTMSTLPIDAILYTESEFKSIQKPQNPHQFNYSKYLELKQVYNQLYIKSNQFKILSHKPTSFYGFADQLRRKINKNITAAGFEAEALSIINALLLGQRQSIDKTIYNNYVNAGTIHILAVSGLHVGVLLLILNFLLKPILYIKHGSVIRPFLVICLLWIFAIMAGLSPSVTRAVTMFSIISVAMHLKRPTNIYNTLAISAFFILLFKPRFLFEVGFQLSYFAVLGIVSIQPMLYKLWRPKYWIINKPWQILTVTLAAQIGVAPISLFYFHQFPGLFFVSNLVIIPFLGLILGFGLLIIVLALLNALPEELVAMYSAIIQGLNAFIAWIAQFEDFLIRDIPFTLLQVIISYAVIIAIVQSFKFKTFKWLALSLIGIICYQAILIHNYLEIQYDAFIIFNKSRFSIIGQKENEKLIIHHNLDSSRQSTDNVIRNYKVGERISNVYLDSLEHIYQFKNMKLLIIDDLGVYKGLNLKPDYVLLRNSPKINLNRVIDSLAPIQIIADASNYKSYIKRWQLTCRNKKIPFHYTNEKGAYILE